LLVCWGFLGFPAVNHGISNRPILLFQGKNPGQTLILINVQQHH